MKLERYRKGFSVFDKDGDGSITVQELREVLCDLGQDVTEKQLYDLIEPHDVDQSGTIEFEEFLPLLARMLGKAIRSMSDLRHLETIQTDQMKDLKEKLAEKTVFGGETKIKKVVLLVVVYDEVRPVLDKFQPKRDHQVEEDLVNLARVYKTIIGDSDEDPDSYELFVLQVAESEQYKRHYSGYTQSAAIVGLVSKVMKPDLLISFGTAGGTVGKVNIGDGVFATGCVFIDRVRTSSKKSHDWGVFGGTTFPAQCLPSHVGLVEGLVGSQISYNVTEQQESLIEALDIYGLDMECAPEAQIAMQTKINFIAIKMISNGIYPGNGTKMEEEYIEHKAMVSKNGTEILTKLFLFLKGKKICDL